MARRSQRPNLFELTGGGVDVTYATTSIDGTPRLHYRDPGRDLNFVGDEIRARRSELGILVTVELEVVPDLHALTFTLVVPTVNAAAGDQRIRTFGVRTTNRTSIGGPGLVAGAVQTYDLVRLRGTASLVNF